ncbi:phosphatidic acid phosphatase [Actinokineospora sp. NBRC 105648]|uniref:phosphatidic acid phosphatase n=1 Tax=Actinokineospora sp. NBRC 105648 TaxID=3032206 RepID=UPI0024A33AAD|nr:phosphatidic acid phosphatase [Actinokineospora sp. NBRC 105648]GLZ38975.1 hypothetical protein Acsp05_25990 [Actinokineospora sp. NBRC 105648]
MRRLLPPELTRPATAVAVLCFAATAALGVAVAGGTAEGPWDAAAFDALDRLYGALPGVVEPVSLTTNPVVMIGLLVVIAAVALVRGRPEVALLAAVGPALAAGVNTWLLKPLFGRTHDDYLAYPSGHTTTFVSIMAVLTLVISANAPPGRRVIRTVTTAGVSFVLFAVAASAIVELRYHYLSDTLGALSWAVGAVITVAAVIDRCTRRTRAARQPAVAHTTVAE